MKVFITGATGYIGSAVAEALRSQGNQVLGLARSAGAEAKLTDAGVQPVRGDMSDRTAIAAAAHQADAVIHAASPSDATSAAADESAVGAILDVLAGTEKPFIYTSGIWVIGDTGGQVFDETAPYNPVALVAWRPAIERKVLQTPGIRSIVIRPGVVYGRGRGIPASLTGPAKREGRVTFVGDGENHWPLIHVDDLADLYVKALAHAPAGTVLFAVNGDFLRVREIAQAASEAAGVAGKLQSWPVEQARTVMGPYADALALDQKVSAEKARQLLGWAPTRPSLLDDLRSGSYA